VYPILVYPVSLGQVWTHSGLNWFFFQNPIFAIFLNFQQQNPFKNTICHTLALKIVKETPLNATHQGLSKTPKPPPQIPIHFLVSNLFSFHWENGSIINSCHTIAPNSLKPSQCTTIHWELSEDTKSPAWSIVVWEIWTWHNKTKQNKLPCFIHRWFAQSSYLYFWANEETSHFNIETYILRSFLSKVCYLIFLWWANCKKEKEK